VVLFSYVSGQLCDFCVCSTTLGAVSHRRGFQADMLVSELLGSFGDNELSPECLDGAQKFLKGVGSGVGVCAGRRVRRTCTPWGGWFSLFGVGCLVRVLVCGWVCGWGAWVCACERSASGHAVSVADTVTAPPSPAVVPHPLFSLRWVVSDDGISIPYKYTSSLAPIMTSKLWNDVKVKSRTQTVQHECRPVPARAACSSVPVRTLRACVCVQVCVEVAHRVGAGCGCPRVG
jgi:hypothetical protein